MIHETVLSNVPSVMLYRVLDTTMTSFPRCGNCIPRWCDKSYHFWISDPLPLMGLTDLFLTLTRPRRNLDGCWSHHSSPSAEFIYRNFWRFETFVRTLKQIVRTLKHLQLARH